MKRIDNDIITMKVYKCRYGSEQTIASLVIAIDNAFVPVTRLTDGVWLGENKKIYRSSTGDGVNEVPKNEYYKYLKYIIRS